MQEAIFHFIVNYGYIRLHDYMRRAVAVLTFMLLAGWGFKVYWGRKGNAHEA